MAAGSTTQRRLDRYAELRAAIAGRSLPLALLDLDAFEHNARAMLQHAGELPIRLCSKSLRSAAVLRHAQQLPARLRGVLCYGAREAAYLAAQGFDTTCWSPTRAWTGQISPRPATHSGVEPSSR